MSDENPEDWSIVGAPLSWTGSAPFVRAKPIVRNTVGENATVVEYSGSSVTLGEMGLTSLFFEPVPLTRNAEVWLLRPHFPHREDALMDMASAGIVLHGPHMLFDVAYAVVHKGTEADSILSGWCEQASDEAIDSAANAYGENAGPMASEALSYASIAFSLCHAPSKSGLYLAILDVTGREEWGNNTATMIEESRGFHYLQSTMTHKNTALMNIYKRRCEYMGLELAKVKWSQGLGTRVKAMTSALSLDPSEDRPTPPTDE